MVNIKLLLFLAGSMIFGSACGNYQNDQIPKLSQTKNLHFNISTENLYPIWMNGNNILGVRSEDSGHSFEIVQFQTKNPNPNVLTQFSISNLSLPIRSWSNAEEIWGDIFWAMCNQKDCLIYTFREGMVSEFLKIPFSGKFPRLKKSTNHIVFEVAGQLFIIDKMKFRRKIGKKIDGNFWIKSDQIVFGDGIKLCRMEIPSEKTKCSIFWKKAISGGEAGDYEIVSSLFRQKNYLEIFRLGKKQKAWIFLDRNYSIYQNNNGFCIWASGHPEVYLSNGADLFQIDAPQAVGSIEWITRNNEILIQAGGRLYLVETYK